MIKRLARERSLQHHLCTFWEDEMINEADGRSCLVESEFPQGDKTNPPTGGEGWAVEACS